MTKNNKLNMGPSKKYVTCIYGIFHPFQLCHFLNFTPTPPLCYSLNFTKKLQNERKEDFFCVYCYFSISRYIKGGEKSHLETQLNF